MKKKSLRQKRIDDEYCRAHKMWLNKADKLWSQMVRDRAKGRCEWCGEFKSLVAHHIIRRSIKPSRHKLENGVALCVGCHCHRVGAPHGSKDSWRFVEWIQNEKPMTWAWVQEHKHDSWRVNYREAYESLTGD